MITYIKNKKYGNCLELEKWSIYMITFVGTGAKYLSTRSSKLLNFKYSVY